MNGSILYSQLKIFHFPEKLRSLTRESASVEPPLHVRIKPTNLCNQHCWYCSYRADALQLGKEMNPRDSIPREKMLEIIGDLEQMGAGAVTFSGGGEPLVYPHMTAVLERIVTGGKLKFAFITNGINLKDGLSEIIGAHGSWVRISVDGWDDGSYGAYRGVASGQWSRLMKNIETFTRTRNGCLLGVYIIVDEKNGPHLYDMVRRYRDLGVNSVKVYGVVMSDDVGRNNAYHARFFDAVKEQSMKAKTLLQDADFQVNDAYNYQAGNFEKTYGWCPYAQITPVIAADLCVYSCHDKAYTEGGRLGSIREQRFRDFWLADKEKFFRIDPRRDCRHHCMVNPQNHLILEYLNLHRGHLEFL
jgi:MoaA/NifB/PqqE/SkfB family radical SAM enzyme